MPMIDNQGQSLYFQDKGTGPAVILGHSFLWSGDMWSAQVPQLARRYRVINVDQRGHGRSGHTVGRFELQDMVSDAVAVLDYLGIERAVWGGLSMGGMIAMGAALDHPGRVSALMLLDTSASGESIARRIKYQAMGFGTSLLGMRPFVPAVLKLMFGRTTLAANRRLVEHWSDRFASVHAPSVRASLRALMGRSSVVSRLGEIGVPTLVTVGEEDLATPPSQAREIADAVPGASLALIPGAGHLTPLERPDAVTRGMLAFLGSLPR